MRLLTLVHSINTFKSMAYAVMKELFWMYLEKVSASPWRHSLLSGVSPKMPVYESCYSKLNGIGPEPLRPNVEIQTFRAPRKRCGKTIEYTYFTNNCRAVLKGENSYVSPRGLGIMNLWRVTLPWRPFTWILKCKICSIH